MWNALYTAEKVIIRWTLLTEACYFGVQFLGESSGRLKAGCRQDRFGSVFQLLSLGFPGSGGTLPRGRDHVAVCSHA